MAASAKLKLSRANSLAFLSRSLPCAPATCWAIRFQWPGGVSVPPPSAQNFAISVCSSVRVALVAEPISRTWLYSEAYRRLTKAGCAGGRNCEGVRIRNGSTKPHCGRRNGANAPGVGVHSPTPWLTGAATTAVAPSCARAARITSATCSPQAMPLALAIPSGIAAR